jgi:hypothetical protein
MVFESEAVAQGHGGCGQYRQSKAGFPCFDLLLMPRPAHAAAIFCVAN